MNVNFENENNKFTVTDYKLSFCRKLWLLFWIRWSILTGRIFQSAETTMKLMKRKMGLKEHGVPSLMTHWIITFITTSWMVTQKGVHQSCSPLRVISGSTMSCLIGKANLAYISSQRVRIRWLLKKLQKQIGKFEELEVQELSFISCLNTAEETNNKPLSCFKIQ